MPRAAERRAQSWDDDTLRTTLGDYAGTGADADLEEVDRFRAGVSRLVGKTLVLRAQLDESSELSSDQLSVFLLEPTGPPSTMADRCQRVPMLDRGREELVGRIWFVPHVVTMGLWMAAEFDTDDALFRFVSDELDLGGTEAIIYDPRLPGPELRFYPHGLGDPATVESLHIAHTELSIDEFLSRIDVLHENQLVTPGAQSAGSRVWSDASKGIPVRRAEEVLGSLITAGLQTAFPTCKVRTEQPGPSGRLDIEVEEPILSEPGTVCRHAVLELKVLRSLNSHGNPTSTRNVATWIRDGVVQAASYRGDKNARAAALCCFDLRREFSGTACFSTVLTLAGELEVRLRSWHLFWSAADYRKHQAETGALTRSGSSQ